MCLTPQLVQQKLAHFQPILSFSWLTGGWQWFIQQNLKQFAVAEWIK